MVKIDEHVDDDERWDTKALDDFEFEISPLFGSSPIIIKQDCKSGYHGFTVWDSAKVMLGYLEKYFLNEIAKSKGEAKALKHDRWVELGAGCGLVSIGLMRFKVESLLITDQPSVFPALNRNIEINTQIMVGDSLNSALELRERISVKPLFWGNDEDINACDPPFDRIVGTDIIFEKENLSVLIDTIIKLSKSNTEVFIAHENRDPEVIELFAIMIAETKLFTAVKPVNRSKYHPRWKRELVEVYKFRMI